MNVAGSLFPTGSGEVGQAPGNVSEFEAPDLTSEQYIFDSTVVRTFFYIVYTIVFAFCVFGNLIVLVVVALHWRMRSITKFFMGNLALTNFLVGIFCVYQNLSTFLTENWAFGRLMCKMYYFTNSMSHTSSILILVVICVERYLAIINPFRGRRVLTIQRLRLTLVAVWFVSAAISSPRLYYITTFEVPLVNGAEGEYEVICAPKRTLYSSRTADMVYFILLFLIPLIVMSILYSRMGKEILKTSAAMLQPSSTISDGPEISTTTTSHIRLDPSSLELSTLNAPNPRGSSGRRRTRKRHESGSTSDSDSSMSSLDERQVSTSSSKNRNRKGNKAVATQPEPTVVSPAGARPLGNNSQTPMTRTTASNGEGCPSSRRVNLQVKDERNGSVLRSRQSVIRMFIVLVASFALCNFPYHLRKICQYYVPNYNVRSYFNQVFTPLSFLLMYTNCAINPILYAFMSKTFRMSLMELVRLDYKRPKPPHVGAIVRRRPST